MQSLYVNGVKPLPGSGPMWMGPRNPVKFEIETRGMGVNYIRREEACIRSFFMFL